MLGREWAEWPMDNQMKLKKGSFLHGSDAAGAI